MDRLQVSLLRVGDVLPGTQERVKVAPYRDLRTPAGKVELVVERAGRARVVTWGARTIVRVSRA